MRQQVNLYQPTIGQTRAPLCARNLGVALAVVIVALSGHSGWNHLRLNEVERGVEAARAEQATRQAQLEAAASTNGGAAAGAELEARVRSLQSALDERRRALQVLRSGAAGRTAGFAPRLEALARRSVEGLWIDRVALSASEGSMTLSGAAIDVDIVPAWLQGLAHEPALAGARFDDFVIERPAAARAEAGQTPALRAIRVDYVRFRVGRTALTGSTTAPRS